MCMVALSASAQLWKEAMYEQYSHNNYTRYEPFNQAIDQTGFDSDLMEAALFYETNRYRAANGKKPLEFDHNLSACARNHTVDMINHNFFSTTSPVEGKKTTADRLKQVGYGRNGYDELIASCSISESYSATAKYIVNEMWAKSSSEDLLDTDYTHLASGAAFYSKGSYIYVKVTHDLLTKLAAVAQADNTRAQVSSAWTKREIDAANTAKDCPYMNQLERDVMLYVNLARMYPKRFIEIEVAGYEHPEGFSVHDGFPGYKSSLIAELRALQPLQPFVPDQELYGYAQCWAEESGRLGLRGHNRVKCAKYAYAAECCSYGVYTAIDIALQWLIDDNVPSLGHRHICLSPKYTHGGISHMGHSTAGHCTVLNVTARH